MGTSAESDRHSKRNLLPGIKNTTERTPTNRNNTSDMLPENNTGKNVEITESTQAFKGMGKYRTPKQSKDTKDTDDNDPTNKEDPTIGSTRREIQDRNPDGKLENTLTKSSISEYNENKHSELTKGKEQDNAKQTYKINPSELANKTLLKETTQPHPHPRPP